MANAAPTLEWCETCGAALGTDKSGHPMYGGFLTYRDFEQILLSLGASGSDVRRLWPGEAPAAATTPEFLMLRVPEGSYIIERYVPDRGGIQWLVSTVKDGHVLTKMVFPTRREAAQFVAVIRG